ncbi:cobalamin B12-binding domain-containing protein [Streptomyces sp. NPDC001941]|uniref:cobalamin B12-binding domain-containing protein n=1 Tax=Streptomyces sp. NPDC001941 TaxID=3154659 RepID=UPI00331AE5CD
MTGPTIPTDPRTPPLPQLQKLFMEALVACSEHDANALTRAWLDDGLGAESLLLDVLAPCQEEIGALWASGTLTVVQEHFATAISERAATLAMAHPSVRAIPPRGRITMACVPGEWHALAARLAADVLRLRGWSVTYLGPHVPTGQLARYLAGFEVGLLALSSSMTTRLPQAHAAIRAAHQTGVPVLAGGAGFGGRGEYGRRLAAEAVAVTARTAAELLDTTAFGPVRPLTRVTFEPPHVEEYLLLRGGRAALLGEITGRSREGERAGDGDGASDGQDTGGRSSGRYGSGGYGDVECAGHVLDFLLAAVYMDDVTVLRDGVRWLGSVARPNTVSGTFRPRDALLVLARRLQDFPRAREFAEKVGTDST